MDKDLESTLQNAAEENEERKTRRFRGSALITEEGYVTFTPQATGEKRVERITVLPSGGYLVKTMGQQRKLKAALVAPATGDVAGAFYRQLEALLDTIPNLKRSKVKLKTIFRNEEIKIQRGENGELETTFKFQSGKDWTRTMAKLMALVNKASVVLFEKQKK